MTNSALELKKFPRFTTDQEAEDFVTSEDLTEFDLSDMKRVRFEFQAKDASVNLRLPKSLLDAVRARAKIDGVPYQRYIRLALEQSLT